MSGTSVEPIYIRAASKSNGITSLVLGCIGLCVAALWLAFLPDWLFLAGIFHHQCRVSVLARRVLQNS